MTKPPSRDRINKLTIIFKTLIERFMKKLLVISNKYFISDNFRKKSGRICYLFSFTINNSLVSQAMYRLCHLLEILEKRFLFLSTASFRLSPGDAAKRLDSNNCVRVHAKEGWLKLLTLGLYSLLKQLHNSGRLFYHNIKKF